MENCFETKTFFCSCGEIWSHWNNFRTLTNAFRKFHDDDDVVGFKIKQIKMFKTSRSLCSNFSASIILENVLCREAIIHWLREVLSSKWSNFCPMYFCKRTWGQCDQTVKLKVAQFSRKFPKKELKQSSTHKERFLN